MRRHEPSQGRFRPRLEELESRTLLSAGALDPAFGSGGTVITSFPTSGVWTSSSVSDLAIQADGKVIVAGISPGNNSLDMSVVRYTSSGQLDSSFGTGGRVTTDFNRQGDWASAVAIQPDGKILAVGGASHQVRSSLQVRIDTAVARYTSTGKLDSTFGNKGKLTLDIGGDDTARDIVLWQNKFIVAGETSALGYRSIYLARFNSNGSLDTTFGAAGKVILTPATPQPDIALAIQTDGKLVVTAMVSSDAGGADFLLARVNVNGTVDATFGAAGIVQTDFGGAADYAKGIAVQADGKITVAGSSRFTAGSFCFAIARYNTDGSLDTGFGLDGRVVTPLADANLSDGAYDLLVQSDGKIVVVGQADSGASSSNGDFAVVRFTGSGGLDPTFGNAGVVITDFGGTQDSAYAVALQSDGRIVAAGKATTISSTGQRDAIALARYLGDSSLTATESAAVASTSSLTADDAESLYSAAVLRWQAAGVDTAAFANVDIRIANLGGTTLGLASGKTIWLDDNAAGWGWFVDATPWEDSEFYLDGDQGEQNRIDLLSVLSHEIGHLLGFEHELEGVMAEALAAGTRQTPAPIDREALLAFFAADDEYSWTGVHRSGRKRSN